MDWGEVGSESGGALLWADARDLLLGPQEGQERGGSEEDQAEHELCAQILAPLATV